MLAPDDPYGEEAASGGLPQLDLTTWPAQIVWVLAAFIVLYVVLSRYLLPKLGGAIEDRRDKIADDLDEAGRLQRQAEEAKKATEEALADAKARAHAIAARTKEDLSAEIAKQAEAAEAEIASQMAAAEARLRAAAEEALANVRPVAEDSAAVILAKFTGAAPDAGVIANAVAKRADVS